jgi:hypothetical protein
MPPLKHLIAGYAAVLSLLMLTGCDSQQPARTGFLADAPLAAMAGDPDALAFTAPAERLRGYRAVWVEPVAFRPGPAAPAEPQAAVLDDLRATYREELSAAFAARNYRVLDSAPADPAQVLHVRAAITGFERANVGLNALTTLVVGPVTAGGAASESEVRDAATGQRLAALATHSNATPFLGGPHNYYRAHGHARAALARHAQDLAAQLPRRPQNWADTR